MTESRWACRQPLEPEMDNASGGKRQGTEPLSYFMFGPLRQRFPPLESAFFLEGRDGNENKRRGLCRHPRGHGGCAFTYLYPGD